MAFACMVLEDEMRDRLPPGSPGHTAAEAYAFEVWLQRGLAGRFGATLEPPPDELVRLAAELFR
jgi:hypothetical protein